MAIISGFGVTAGVGAGEGFAIMLVTGVGDKVGTGMGVPGRLVEDTVVDGVAVTCGAGVGFGLRQAAEISPKIIKHAKTIKHNLDSCIKLLILLIVCQSYLFSFITGSFQKGLLSFISY